MTVTTLLLVVLLTNVEPAWSSISTCLNNSTFSFNNSWTTCSWVRWKEERRQSLCQLEEIRAQCPQSCGLCCKDDETFKFVEDTLPARNCSWIMSTSSKQYCDKFKNGRMIRDACPVTCDFCQSEVEPIPPGGPPDHTPPKGRDDSERAQNKRSAEIILGTVLSSVSFLSLIVLYKNCKDKDRDKITVTTEKNSRKLRTARTRECTPSTVSQTLNGAEGDIEENQNGQVSPDGVSVFWIKNKFLKEVQGQGLNTSSTLQDLLDCNIDNKSVIKVLGENEVCPRDGQLGAAVVDCLEGEDYVGPSTFVLSCHEDNSIGKIVDTLWDYCFYKSLNPKRTYVWAPLFNMNQHRNSDNKIDSQKRIRYEQVDLFRGCLSSIGNLFVIVSPWEVPRIFLGEWGIIELYYAIKSRINVVVAMSPKERERMIMKSLQNENDLLELFDKIDSTQIHNTEIPDPSKDRYSPEQSKKKEINLDKMNKQVNKFLRKWAKGEIIKALNFHEARSKDVTRDEDIAFLNSQVGYVLSRVDESSDALDLYQKAIQIYTNVRGEKHTDVASLYMNTGMVLQATGDLDGAIKEYLKVLDIDHIVYGDNHIETSNTYNTIGMAMELDGDLDGAVANYQKSLDIREKLLGAENQYTAQSYNHIGLVLNSMGQYDKALEALQKSHDIYVKVKGLDHPYTAQSSTNIGYVLHKKGDFESALKSFKAALGAVEKNNGDNNTEATASAYNNVAMALESMDDLDSALFHYNVALQITKGKYGEQHADTGISYNNLGGILLAKGDHKGAMIELSTALKILVNTLGSDHHHTQVVRDNIQRCKEAAI